MRFSSAWVKICQILHVTFELRSQFLFKFTSLSIVMTHNSPVNFKLIFFLLWTKGAHQSPIFDTFKCSGENLPYSSCQVWNDKSIFLWILHESSVTLYDLWNITLLYFFRWNVTYFPRNKPIKVQIFETFECSYQISPNSCHFWNNKLVFLHILHHSSVSWDTTPFLTEFWKLPTEGAYRSTNLVEFHVSSLKFALWWVLFVQTI